MFVKCKHGQKENIPGVIRKKPIFSLYDVKITSNLEIIFTSENVLIGQLFFSLLIDDYCTL